MQADELRMLLKVKADNAYTSFVHEPAAAVGFGERTTNLGAMWLNLTRPLHRDDPDVANRRVLVTKAQNPCNAELRVVVSEAPQNEYLCLALVRMPLNSWKERVVALALVSVDSAYVVLANLAKDQSIGLQHGKVEIDSVRFHERRVRPNGQELSYRWRERARIAMEVFS